MFNFVLFHKSFFLRGGIRGGFDVCKATFTKLQNAFIHVGISLDLSLEICFSINGKLLTLFLNFESK
jgi:hypothetical protein